MIRKFFSILLIISFFISSTAIPWEAQAQDVLELPKPGTMVNLTPAYVPLMVKGLRVHPENPILFDFIVDTGNSGLSTEDSMLKSESEKLIKYFLASLTLPEEDLWVNLSPYEKDRIVPEQLGQTEMGRDMLAQDYVLKQLTASLIYPEKELGKEFWNKVYTKAQALYGSTEIPVNTFNKVWIVADKAKVYVHDNTAFVVGSHLKVMLEEDYLASQKHDKKVSDTFLSSQIIREIVLPELEKEVNEGKTFANLRQIFHSMILATWYKKSLRDSLLNQVYSNKAKINGVDTPDKTIKDQIYQEYLKAYKKGVFNYIKDDVQAGQTVSRKYFSGGVAPNLGLDRAMRVDDKLTQGDNTISIGTTLAVTTSLSPYVESLNGLDSKSGAIPEEFDSYISTLEQVIVSQLSGVLINIKEIKYFNVFNRFVYRSKRKLDIINLNEVVISYSSLQSSFLKKEIGNLIRVIFLEDPVAAYQLYNLFASKLELELIPIKITPRIRTQLIKNPPIKLKKEKETKVKLDPKKEKKLKQSPKVIPKKMPQKTSKNKIIIKKKDLKRSERRHVWYPNQTARILQGFKKYFQIFPHQKFRLNKWYYLPFEGLEEVLTIIRMQSRKGVPQTIEILFKEEEKTYVLYVHSALSETFFSFDDKGRLDEASEIRLTSISVLDRQITINVNTQGMNYLKNKGIVDQLKGVIHFEQDPAEISKIPPYMTPGGIDFNSQSMQIEVVGNKIDTAFDKAMLKKFQDSNFSGVKPIIKAITPIINIQPFMGLYDEVRP